LLTAALAAIGASSAKERNMQVGEALPSFAGAVEWFNAKPLTATGLRGKVVLVQFWTYTCVNWLRTLPYVRAWAEKYKDPGLVVIGVHTPEFGFEKNLDNIQRAIKEMGIVYPVAVDSNYAIWNAFGNHYWPALYLADARGRIRYQHFGEGDYEESERVIQRLLVEAGSRGVASGLVTVQPHGLEVAANWDDVESPETFLGYDRTEKFVSPGGVIPNERHVYGAPSRLDLNSWALAGEWTMGKDVVASGRPGGRIAFRFHARDVNLIMGPKAPGASVRFHVLVDGQAPGAGHGGDADAGGFGTVSQQRTYQLLRQPKPIVDRRFEIEFLDPGAEAFDFTFG
jgi:thiol-disulfide isomerase/thioredoxin